jgi:hypothetical protein
MEMRLKSVAILLVCLSLAACANHSIWHDQVLPSGRTIKVTSFNLVWGIEHDERDVSKDCLQIEFVWSNPAADAAAQEKEAWEVFELIRPASELWQFKSAVVSVFPTLEHTGHHSFFSFTRGADGKWSSTRGEL